MEFFKKTTNIDFMGIRNWTALFSCILIVGSIMIIMIKGLNWGLDFTGGYQIEANFNHVPSITEVQSKLEAVDLHHAEIITFGTSKQLMIRLMPKDVGDLKGGKVNETGVSTQTLLQKRIQSALGSEVHINQVNYIGPEVGEELATKGLLALIVAMICMVVYIALRFEYRFALSAGIALLHDPIIILGVFSLFHYEFNLTSLAAILAVVGYSLNDTVVIYDRVRENFLTLRQSSVVEIINRSVNDTLSRTVITSGLTLLVVTVLFFFGGPSIHEFSLALILGVIIGTYSSIYVAGVLAVKFGLQREHLLPPKRNDELTSP